MALNLEVCFHFQQDCLSQKADQQNDFINTYEHGIKLCRISLFFRAPGQIMAGGILLLLLPSILFYPTNYWSLSCLAFLSITIQGGNGLIRGEKKCVTLLGNADGCYHSR